jgi:hypothetical protein
LPRNLRAEQANLALGLEAIAQEDSAADLRAIRRERTASGLQPRAVACEVALDLRSVQANFAPRLTMTEKKRAMKNGPVGGDATCERAIEDIDATRLRGVKVNRILTQLSGYFSRESDNIMRNNMMQPLVSGTI